MGSYTKDDLKMLVQVGFVACMHGEVGEARNIFGNLLEYDPELKQASIGMALSHIVVDEFKLGDEILDGLPQDDDVMSIKVLSLGLQKRADEARNAFASVRDKGTPEAKMAALVLECIE